MASNKPYIPNKQADLDAWFTNFSTLIAANPAQYGLTTADAANIASSVAAWIAAYAPVTSPSTKTAQAVSAKNSAKVITLAQLRPYAQSISNNPAVTSANKIALGLNPKTSTPSTVTAPGSNPILSVQSAANLSIVLRYRDSAGTVAGKGKPYGVKQCQVFGGVSATPISTPQASAPLLGTPTKSPFILQFPSTAAGMQCYMWARWATQAGAVSPWSPVVSCTVPQIG